MHEEFDAIVERNSRLIAYRAQKYIPGLTYDERRALIVESLWRAWSTHDESRGLNLSQYWWVIWSRERAKHLEAHFRFKRQMVTPAAPETLQELAAAYLPEIVPQCPVRGAEPVWRLLAMGYPHRHVRRLLGMSRYRFDTIMDALRSPETRALLTG